MKYLIGFLYAMWLSFWRRWHGTTEMFGKKYVKAWWNSELVKKIANMIITFGVLTSLGHKWWTSLLAVLVFQFLYFTRSHGAYWDFGHGASYDERYEKNWWIKYVRKLIPEKQWYTFSFDYICMILRYGLPSCLMALILGSPLLCFMGFVHASAYALCWKIYDWGKMKDPTEKAEWLAGFLSGLFIGFC